MFKNCAITDFSEFDSVMKINLLQSASNLCDQLFHCVPNPNQRLYLDCSDYLDSMIEFLEADLY